MTPQNVNLYQIVAQVVLEICKNPNQQVHVKFTDERDVMAFTEVLQGVMEAIKIELVSTERGPNPEVPVSSVADSGKLIVPKNHDQVVHPKGLIVPHGIGGLGS